MIPPSLDRLVVVEWEDAWTRENWVPIADVGTSDAGPEICYTADWVLLEQEDGIYIAQTMAPPLWFIPSGMIREVRLLKLGAKA